MSCFINEADHGSLFTGGKVTVIAHPYSSIEIHELSVSTDGCVWLRLVNGFTFNVKYYKSTGWSLVEKVNGKIRKLPRDAWQQNRYRLVKRKERPQ